LLSITETSKEQPSVREGKFQIGEFKAGAQADFCIFSHAAYVKQFVDYQYFTVRLSIFYIFLTDGIPFHPPNPPPHPPLDDRAKDRVGALQEEIRRPTPPVIAPQGRGLSVV